MTKINNHMHYREWDEITYPFPNFNGLTKCGMKLFSHSQSSTVQPYKFRIGLMNSSHTLPDIFLLRIYLNQWWPGFQKHVYVIRPWKVNGLSSSLFYIKEFNELIITFIIVVSIVSHMLIFCFYNIYPYFDIKRTFPPPFVITLNGDNFIDNEGRNRLHACFADFRVCFVSIAAHGIGR